MADNCLQVFDDIFASARAGTTAKAMAFGILDWLNEGRNIFTITEICTRARHGGHVCNEAEICKELERTLESCRKLPFVLQKSSTDCGAWSLRL